MLSQLKRRLLLHPLLLENTFTSPSVARFSSKKGPKEPFVSAQEPKNNDEEVPKDIFETKLLPKRPKSKVYDEASEIFDAVLNASFGPDKNQEYRSKKAKPGQLNIQMAKAANNVADMAGSKKKEVLGDLMDQLNSVFPGMENHAKGRRKSSKTDKKSALGSKHSYASDESNIEDIVGMAVAQRGPRTKFQGGSNQRDRKTETSNTGDIEECDAINTALSGGGYKWKTSDFSEPRGPQFVGKPFQNLDKLLKSQEPLGIFTSKLSPSTSLSMWQKFEETELKRCTRFEPLNWFDQCIQWTEQGKLWHFPIDNEQGMDKEAEVDFSEHIFLDHHADPWCPKEGPIKYFMELVLVGLSKNAFLTVEEKKATIDWYRDYFMKNKSVLEEINVFGSPQNPIEVEGKMS